MGLFYVWKAMNSHEFASVQAGKLASYPKGSRRLRILPGVEANWSRSSIRPRFHDGGSNEDLRAENSQAAMSARRAATRPICLKRHSDVQYADPNWQTW